MKRAFSTSAAAPKIAQHLAPAIQVLGLVQRWGRAVRASFGQSDVYEFQNYTPIIHGTHSWRFGAACEARPTTTFRRRISAARSSFSGGLAPRTGCQQSAVVDARATATITSDRAISPDAAVSDWDMAGRIRAWWRRDAVHDQRRDSRRLVGQADVGVFFGDDWRMRPNLTLSFGLRYETQTNIHDWQISRPAWGRMGAGRQRPRRGENRATRRVRHVLRSLRSGEHADCARYDGIVQQQYVVTNPDFLPEHSAHPFLADFQSTQTVQKSVRRCARRTSCSRPSASSASCRTTLRLRSPTQMRTGCTSYARRTSTLPCRAPFRPTRASFRTERPALFS